MRNVTRLVADFETIPKKTHSKGINIKTDNITLIQNHNETRVWASCMYDIENDEIIQLSNNIEEFIYVLSYQCRKNNLEIYFHNLKFDGEFILSYLYSNGFQYSDFLDKPNTFRTVITDMGLFYQLEIRFHNPKKCKIVTIRDSLKIIPLKVSQMSNAFGLKALKGDIDYKQFRPLNHKLTSTEIEYIKNDVIIVGKSLKAMFDLGLTKMTIASNSINNYKESIGGNAKFRGYYPLLKKVDDDFIRKSYKGGYTYVNPSIQGKNLNKVGMTFDVNSLYPSQMYYKMLPYDMPFYYKGEYKHNEFYPLYIQRIKCKFKLKKGYVPIIQIKHNSRFSDSEYLKESGVERIELTLTNIDLEMIKEHYTLINVEYLDGYMFKGAYNLFQNYIDYWIGVKKQAEKDGNPGLRSIAKLMLNSLYGKFATSGVSDVKIPFMCDEVVKHQIKCKIAEEEDFNGSLKEDKDRELNYTAMACFITAYSRQVTINAIQEVGGLNKGSRFCYCDTDSIHILGEEMPNIWVDKLELGAWKHESTWSYGKFIRAKTYIEEIDGDLDVKCAGMPDNVKELVNKNNFKSNFKVLAADTSIDDKYKKLMPKRIKGGIVLVETDFTIQ